MNNNRTILLFLAVAAGSLLLPIPPSASAAEEAILLSVTRDGSSATRHPTGYPLRVEVNLSNPTARNLLLDQIAAKTGAQKRADGSAEKTQVSAANIPEVTLGSTGEPLFKSLLVTASVAKNSKRVVALHPLAQSAKMMPATVSLNGDTALSISYGADATTLSFQPGAQVEVVARLAADHKPAPATAAIETKSLRIEFFNAKQLAPAQKVAFDYAAGRYYVMEERFNQVGQYADRLERSSPQLAAVLRAEAYWGLGDKAKAREACHRALALYGENTKGEPGAEPPLYLFELLKQIDEGKK